LAWWPGGGCLITLPVAATPVRHLAPVAEGEPKLGAAGLWPDPVS
jgi:hypothetical protein